MSEKKFGASVSWAAMEAALEDLEKRVDGRIDDQEFERLFGQRWAKLKARGVINDPLIMAYAGKAAEQERGEGLFDEVEQARLLLGRYDERHAATPTRRRRTAKAAEAATAGGVQDGRRDASEHRRSEDESRRPEHEGRSGVPIGGGQETVLAGEPSPDQPADGERAW